MVSVHAKISTDLKLKITSGSYVNLACCHFNNTRFQAYALIILGS